jgi:hypothetical protein
VLFDPLDPGWQCPDPRSGIFLTLDPGSVMEKLGSGMIVTYLLVTWRVVSSPPFVGGLKIHPGCVVVDPLLSVVADSGHLNGLPLGKLVLSGSILGCSITVHFSLFCVF